MFILTFSSVHCFAMKIVRTEISQVINERISIIERDEPYFKSPFHFHPEFELVYITESYGKRIIGDKVDTFKEGDMVFVGSNLPHLWQNDEVFYKGKPGLRAKAIVLYFDSNILGPEFLKMKESVQLDTFFKNGERGILVKGKTRDTIANKLKKLLKKKNFDRVIGLFEIFHLLSVSNELEFITSDGYKHSSGKNNESDRLSVINQYVHENFRKDISLADIAAVACFTPPSFCRFFKQRTGKHFVEYLNEVRVSKACGYLLDTDWTISEIAFRCGYKTASNFNKIFKEIKGTNPKAYRGNASK